MYNEGNVHCLVVAVRCILASQSRGSPESGLQMVAAKSARKNCCDEPSIAYSSGVRQVKLERKGMQAEQTLLTRFKA